MLDVSGVDARVMKVLDIKTPASGEMQKNLWGNLQYLNPRDEIKFVLCDEADYLWAKQVLAEHKLAQRCAVLFSPHRGSSPPRSGGMDIARSLAGALAGAVA